MEALFVVSGFTKCKILHQRLEKEFSALQLVIPEDPSFAIVKGAVRYGPVKAIASRTSYATYGVDCQRPFRDGDDSSKKIWSERHQSYYCKDIFSVFVTKGQKVLQRYMHRSKTGPNQYYHSHICHRCNRSKYVIDPGCVKIGTLSINIIPLPAGATAADDNCKVTVKMVFSGSEIFVIADDNTGQYHSE